MDNYIYIEAAKEVLTKYVGRIDKERMYAKYAYSGKGKAVVQLCIALDEHKINGEFICYTLTYDMEKTSWIMEKTVGHYDQRIVLDRVVLVEGKEISE